VSDWINHNGGPQPVADDVWVEMHGVAFDEAGALHWNRTVRYRILNQHLIDAARREGIRLGLMAAKRAIEPLYDPQADDILQALNPDTIAREAQDMGSGKETT